MLGKYGHLWAASPDGEVLQPPWPDLYDTDPVLHYREHNIPGPGSLTCRRCGCAVHDLTAHEEFHQSLDDDGDEVFYLAPPEDPPHPYGFEEDGTPRCPNHGQPGHDKMRCYRVKKAPGE